MFKELDLLGSACIAIRLRSMVQELHSEHIHTDEKKIRLIIKQRYGKSHCGTQHFLDPQRTSPKPAVRNQTYSNTKIAKCVFIAYEDIGQEILLKLHSG